MDINEHYRRMESAYLSAPINSYYQPSIVIEHEKATISCDVKEDFHHAMGAVHGSVYFKMLDDVAYFAANSIITDSFLVTTDFHLHMLRPIREGQLRAEGKLRYKSQRLFVAEGCLYDHRGREIAIGTGTFVKSRWPMPQDPEA